MAMNLTDGQRAQRKKLITVAAWGAADQTTGIEANRQILGVRTEDSSIELNPEINTTTDILGITYTDVEKTEPQQTFDPFFVVGGSDLHEYLTDAMLTNDIDKWNGAFTMYIIAAYSGTSNSYTAVKHTGCSIIPTSLGGDSYVNMPIEVHYSNNLTSGTVDKLTDDFRFSAT